jgi:hypothetical protein
MPTIAMKMSFPAHGGLARQSANDNSYAVLSVRRPAEGAVESAYEASSGVAYDPVMNEFSIGPEVRDLCERAWRTRTAINWHERPTLITMHDARLGSEPTARPYLLPAHAQAPAGPGTPCATARSRCWKRRGTGTASLLLCIYHARGQ